MSTFDAPTSLTGRTARPRYELPRPAGLALLIGLCSISALAGRLVYILKPFDHDARMFIYLGKLVADGGRFGHDLIDNKFPSVGLMTSLPWKWFGTHWSAYVLFQSVLALVGALMLGRIASRHFGKYAGLPTLLFGLVYLNLNVAVFGGFQLETMQAFFAILAAGAAIEALAGGPAVDAFACGLAAGCAVMIKPSGGAVLAAFAVATCVAWWRYKPRVALLGVAATAGFAIPLAGVFAYLLVSRTLGDMPMLYHQIARYASETPLERADFLKPVVVLVIGGFPIAIRAWVYRRPRERIDGATVDPTLLLFASLWLAFELAGVVAQRRMYAYHFFVVIPPAALLYGIWPRKLRLMPIAAALVPAAMLSLLGAKETLRDCYPPVYRMAVSDYVASHTRPGDTVWMDSVPRLLLETDRSSGSRIPLAFLFFNYDAAPLDYSAVMLTDFDDRKPKYVILPADLDKKLAYETARAPEMARRPVRAENYRVAWHRIDEYVKSNYDEETRLEGQIVYRRKETETARIE